MLPASQVPRPSSEPSELGNLACVILPQTKFWSRFLIFLEECRWQRRRQPGELGRRQTRQLPPHWQCAALPLSTTLLIDITVCHTACHCVPHCLYHSVPHCHSSRLRIHTVLHNKCALHSNAVHMCTLQPTEDQTVHSMCTAHCTVQMPNKQRCCVGAAEVGGYFTEVVSGAGDTDSI